MKAADLDRAQALAGELAAVRRLAERIGAGEALHLMLGSGPGASEIVLSQAYGARLRADVAASLHVCIAALEDALAALGVEP